MLTQREIFDKVKTHLLAQNERCTSGGPWPRAQCLYRNYKGQSCAIGCLIADEHYSEDFEESGVFILQDLYDTNPTLGPKLRAKARALDKALRASGIDPSAEGVWNLLCVLQTVHDSALPANWGPTLSRIESERFGLE